MVGLYQESQRHRPDKMTFGVRDDDCLGEVVEQLDEYFAGRLRKFDVAIGLSGTPFQLRVWNALSELDYGQTVSYGRLAEMIGSPTAIRAVGAANGRNRLSIVVPCHRVVGASGSLTGYAGGVDRKRWLLRLEGAAVST